jgi:hypothetical protein
MGMLSFPFPSICTADDKPVLWHKVIHDSTS